MRGAAVLCAQSAARVGAGYVTLVTEDAASFPIHKHPDFLVHDVSEKKFPWTKFSALAAGPGWGQGGFPKALLKKVLSLKTIPRVLDADALNLLAQAKRTSKLQANCILTPHEGELARLLKTTPQKIRANRVDAVLAAQKTFGGVVLLKGAGTLVADATRLVQIDSGNAALAKAGTGDVLTGMIAGFLSQQVQPFEAACLGAFVHGFLADQWVLQKNDVLSLMASDLVAMIPQGLALIRNGGKIR
jgi:ADP-dependent NAD(P)H-hydrate dehydratase